MEGLKRIKGRGMEKGLACGTTHALLESRATNTVCHAGYVILKRLCA